MKRRAMAGAWRRTRRNWVLVGAWAAAGLCAAGSAGAAPPTPAAAPPVRPTSSAVPRSQNEELYVRRRWGIDGISLRSISSGSAVEFRYRVIDPDKATVLNDTKATPTLTDQKTGQKLVVPQLENIGTLRQVAKPAAGKEYWMIFQDPLRVVKSRSRVDVAVGVFRLNGLTVE